jgi:hypothetical protein
VHSHRFLNKQGKELIGEAIFRPTQVQKKLVTVQLRDLSSHDFVPRCPDGL